MKQFKNFESILKEIRENPKLKSGEIIIVEVDRECDFMLKDAYCLTADGTITQAPWATVTGTDPSDSAEIFLSDDGDAVVSFHLTRPSRRDHRPNGIRIHHDELYVPCVVFVNSGKQALTLDGNWIKPGEYDMVYELDMNDPDVQAVFQKEFLQRPDVQAEIRKLQQEYSIKIQQKH